MCGGGVWEGVGCTGVLLVDWQQITLELSQQLIGPTCIFHDTFTAKLFGIALNFMAQSVAEDYQKG